AVAAPVRIDPTNRVVVRLSANVNPCTVSPDTVRFFQHAVGAAGTMPTGFSPASDQTPGDPFTWGSGTATSPPRRVNAKIVLTQALAATTIEVLPILGEFPDDALLTVELNGIEDFGGNALVPATVAFVTENRP